MIIERIKESYNNYAEYLWNDITLQNEGGLLHNYFWMLVIVSAFFFLLEIIKPWRSGQKLFRKDFWLDFFYMFFNFFSVFIDHLCRSFGYRCGFL